MVVIIGLNVARKCGGGEGQQDSGKQQKTDSKLHIVSFVFLPDYDSRTGEFGGAQTKTRLPSLCEGQIVP
jgi:hypothetical protein